MNKYLDAAARSAARIGLVNLVRNLEARQSDLLRILVYHRIGDPGAEEGLLDPSLVSATPEQFEQQMRYLAENYHLLSIADLLHAIEIGEPLPPNSVMVTFDDGYRDFLDTAWPVLEYYQIPTLLFLTTGFLSSSTQLYWWDRLYQAIFKTHAAGFKLPNGGEFQLTDSRQRWEAFQHLKRQFTCLDWFSAMLLVDRIIEILKVIPVTTGQILSWSEVRFLYERGCYLGAHTCNHPIMARIPLEFARQQLHDAQQDISREIGRIWPVFAYPYGHSQDCSPELLPILSEEGYQIAMTSTPGINVLPKDNLLLLKRIGTSPRLTLPYFQLVITGIYHVYATFQRTILHKD